MRCPSPLLALLALLASTACNPAANPFSLGTPSADDASALTSAFGDDGGWGDDGGITTGGPTWDARTTTSPEDATVPVVPSDDAAAEIDAGLDGECTQPLGAGDLLIDELMIESVAGAGDDGEWLEVANLAGCALNLRGLHGECPVGAKVHSFDVTADLWLAPGGTFILADSPDPAVNHYLPGLVLAWSGHPGDVLRNLGGTVTLTVGGVLVDTVTWPSLKPPIGTSVELPADCPAEDDADFGVWQPSTASWFPGFQGTPNAPNTDVQCPP